MFNELFFVHRLQNKQPLTGDSEMNAYDAWLESPYQESASYDEALEAAEEIESAQLTRELNSKPATRVELFDEAMGYRTEAQADAMVLAWSKSGKC